MNEKIINVGLIIGEDIRTRARIGEIKSLLNPDDCCILDFSLVEFISRSFADELVGLIEDSANKIKIINANAEVESMISIVREGRMHSTYNRFPRGVKVLKNLQELERFFSCL